MFERFTERARQVVVLAQVEARTLEHNYIGTEHILLGLLCEQEGLAARVLESLDVSAERVRAEIVRIVGVGEEVSPGQIPFTRSAKKVLESALREALSLGHDYIGTEHILLGLVRENQGVAAEVLLSFEADAEKIRSEVMRTLSGPGGRGRGEFSQVSIDRSSFDFTPDEAFDLARSVAPLAREIKFEVRPHGGGEPTFRVSCELSGSEGVLRELVALEDAGIRVVLDHGRSVRFGHRKRPVQLDSTETSAE